MSFSPFLMSQFASLVCQSLKLAHWYIKRRCISEANAYFYTYVYPKQGHNVFHCIFYWTLWCKHNSRELTLIQNCVFNIRLCVMPTRPGSEAWRQPAAPSGRSQSFPPCALTLKAWRFLFAFLLQQRSPWRILFGEFPRRWRWCILSPSLIVAGKGPRNTGRNNK